MKKTFMIIIMLMTISHVVKLQAKELSGRDIMVLVDERDDGNDRRVEMEMILINKRGRKRIRQIL
ncbi:MAG: outer membrane lipoprotein-sorting protein, partial [Candidatus Cloacimonetes bacterium]|nr:outer membrane lipoprotein-sorting protein [Candidatus Cloacimonadota bacterium]